MLASIGTAGWIAIVVGGMIGFGLVRLLIRSLAARLEAAPPPPSPPPPPPPPPAPPPTSTSADGHWSDVLGVAPGASQEEIKSAYRRLMAQYHPDKVAALGPELKVVAERVARRINIAYDAAMLERR